MTEIDNQTSENGQASALAPSLHGLDSPDLPLPDQRRLRVVLTLIISMTLVALGNGLLFAYVPIRLAALGFEPFVAGALIVVLALLLAGAAKAVLVLSLHARRL